MRLDNATITIPGAAFALVLAACSPQAARPGSPPSPTPKTGESAPPRDPRETHIDDLRQLTFGGENAEAYWSSDGTELILQSTHPPYACDQIFRLDANRAGADLELVSTGTGRTTCAYFFPGDQRVLFASTHAGGEACPPVPDHSQGYVWPLYDSYDIYSAKPDGKELRALIASPGYDAEATVCARDGSIIFTSTRDDDIELYRADADGSNVVRLTSTPGYDGGAFFSADCKQIVWRASRPAPGPELEEFRALLHKGLVKPGKLELYVADADGSQARQITYLDAASFAPFFFPSGKRVIFSSNHGDPKGREFDLWAVNTDGTGLERISYSAGFDGFPIFSPDGKRIAFSSNRNQRHEGDTDVYVATWKEGAPASTSAPSSADRTMADVRWLADDAREGRGVGTAGLDAAADWIAHKLSELGALAPSSGFKQAFEVTVGASVVAEATSVQIDGKALPAGTFAPLGFSLSGVAEGDVVAANFGVTAPEQGWDDYKKLDVKGKIVVVRRFAPDGEKFKDDRLTRRYGDLHYKAWNAREHGARALVVVDVPVKGAAAQEDAPLPKIGSDGQGDAGLPVIVLTRAAGAVLFTGKHKAVVRVGLNLTKKPTYNVIARIEAPAAGKLPGVVVIGAHYDHLGMGQTGSLSPDVVAVHNGADDNASGVAALLEVGRTLVARRAELKRDVWLVAFSAEEMGVLGSSYFVKHPPAGLVVSDVVAMLNMDMVGRLRQNRLTVLGGESASEWPELVSSACKARRVDCTVNGSGYGPSDHTPFYAAGVPVLHFFSGAHEDYHKPTDDAPFINAAGMAQVALVVSDVALAAATRAGKLTLRAEAAPPPDGDRRNHGASLGTVPDYSGPPAGKTGVLLSGVRAGSPAEKAGVLRGDLLVGIGSHEVRTIEDFMFVLRNAKPGDKTTVTVERAGKKLTLDVTLGESTRR